jgi:NAD(P)-dependent dehydrogenase (short-subunit alcohol dehydrogenase family)
MDLQKMFNLNGRKALVTGSSRGIGKAIAMTLAQAGAQVFVHGSHPGEKLDAAVKEICDSGGSATAVSADLGCESTVKQLIEQISNIDILVLNASVQSYQPVEEFTTEEFDRQYAVNLRSAFQLIQAVVPEMKNRHWGRLLAIGSVNQYTPSPRLPIYSTTKSALANLMINCARQYAPYGITANNLAPGVICTDRNTDALKDEAYKMTLLKMIPAGRFGSVEDCAGLALLLCSDAGSYITGADIPVTGGMHL